MTPMLSVSNRLAEELRALGWSPEQLAEICGLGRAAVQRALKEQQMSARERARIVAALNQGRAQQSLPEVLASQVFPQG